jgi:hypothetical protein
MGAGEEHATASTRAEIDCENGRVIGHPLCLRSAQALNAFAALRAARRAMRKFRCTRYDPARLSSDIPGLGSWPLALSRVVRDHNPERQLQPDPRPVYLIEINVLQFPFHGGRPGRVFAARFDRCLLYSPQSVHVAFMSP